MTYDIYIYISSSNNLPLSFGPIGTVFANAINDNPTNKKKLGIKREIPIE